MKKLEKIIIYAQKNFSEEFKSIIPCDESDNHDWFINPSANRTDIRLIDIECKNCKINLAVLLRLFSGIQDHN